MSSSTVPFSYIKIEIFKPWRKRERETIMQNWNYGLKYFSHQIYFQLQYCRTRETTPGNKYSRQSSCRNKCKSWSRPITSWFIKSTTGKRTSGTENSDDLDRPSKSNREPVFSSKNTASAAPPGGPGVARTGRGQGASGIRTVRRFSILTARGIAALQYEALKFGFVTTNGFATAEILEATYTYPAAAKRLQGVWINVTSRL